jgi:MFS family permease
MFWLDVAITAIIVVYMMGRGLFAEAVPVVIVKLLAFNAIQAIYMATTVSSISQLAPSDKLASGNAVIMVVNMLSITGGMALAGILYDRVGLFPILVGGAVCFAVTAIVDLFIRIPYKKQDTSGGILQIVKGDLSESIRFVTKQKPLIGKCLVPIFLMEFLFGSMIMIGIPVLVTGHLDMSMTHVGIAMAIMMFGGVLGGIIAGALGTRLSISKGFVFIIIGIMFSVPMGLVLLFETQPLLSYIIVVAAGSVFAISAKIFSIAIMTYIQVETPTELIGKVLSVLMVFPFVGQSIGYPIQGRLFEQFADSPWLVIFGVTFAMIVVALYAYWYFKKELRIKT